MKKSLVKNWLFGLMAVVSFASLAMPNDAHAWDIVCRGGGNAEIRFTSWETGAGMMLFFWKAEQPTSEGLEPGQCSWPDRGMWSSEPTAICMGRNLVNQEITININRHKTWAITPDPMADTIRAMFTLVHDSNFYYTLDVENNGRDCLVPSR